MNDYQLQLECDLALKKVMAKVDMFIRNEKYTWELWNIWIPKRIYPYYPSECIQPTRNNACISVIYSPFATCSNNK